MNAMDIEERRKEKSKICTSRQALFNPQNCLASGALDPLAVPYLWWSVLKVRDRPGPRRRLKAAAARC